MIDDEERELQFLLDSSSACAITGCENSPIDTRGRIYMRDGREYDVCTLHWEAIIIVVGQQPMPQTSDDELDIDILDNEILLNFVEEDDDRLGPWETDEDGSITEEDAEKYRYAHAMLYGEDS